MRIVRGAGIEDSRPPFFVQDLPDLHSDESTDTLPEDNSSFAILDMRGNFLRA